MQNDDKIRVGDRVGVVVGDELELILGIVEKIDGVGAYHVRFDDGSRERFTRYRYVWGNAGVGVSLQKEKAAEAELVRRKAVSNG